MDNEAKDFIRQRIEQDQTAGKLPSGVITRFPPEPNGYLHIGHAKSICLNFGVAQEYGGSTFLRFDDTNPIKESEEFVDAIARDVAWLGFQWSSLTHASDYFEELYKFAQDLIRDGKAYVDERSLDEIRATRGDFHTPGQDSPHRDRPVDESLELFEKMKSGALPEGAAIIRAMPNTPAQIGEGATALVANAHATAGQRAAAERLMAAAGMAVWLDDEAQMDAATAVSGSGPAYVFLMAECLEEAARGAGLAPDLARALARHLRCRLLAVRGPELLSKFVGASERAVPRRRPCGERRSVQARPTPPCSRQVSRQARSQ